MQSYPASCHFIPLRSKYSLQHSAPKYSHSMFFPHCERSNFTLIETGGQIMVLYILIFKFFERDRKTKD
jgi:hypothetical protein